MSLKGKRRMVDNLILMPQKASFVDLYSYQARIVFSMYVNSLRYGYNYWKLTTNFQGNICFKIYELKTKTFGFIFEI